MSFKTNKINRSFSIKVHLYFNKESFNRTTDSTPRFYLKPVQLLAIDKVAFTRVGGVNNSYDRYGNRFWKYKDDSTLTKAQADAIYEEIKKSYPYGYVENDQASIKKYRYDVTENEAFQSFYKKYWDDHSSDVKQPSFNPNGTKQQPHPYIEFTVNEIITYKHVSGTVEALPEASEYDVYYATRTGEYYSQPIDYSCHDETIDVSLDAFHNETYKQIRVGGNLDITKKNVLKLLELNKKNNYKTKIIISFVEQKKNSSEIELFKKFWKNMGANEVLIRKLHTNSGSNENDLVNDHKNRTPCLYPWERVVLTAKGMLSFCPTDWYGKSEIVNYRKATIQQVWQNNFYKNLREQHLSCKFSNKFCKSCPDWKNTSWPDDHNKSYADLVETVLYNES